jgi:hypothetical protein
MLIRSIPNPKGVDEGLPVEFGQFRTVADFLGRGCSHLYKLKKILYKVSITPVSYFLKVFI